MPFETRDDSPPCTTDVDVRGLRIVRYRIALLLLTFSVVMLPNIFSFAADILGD